MKAAIKILKKELRLEECAHFLDREKIKNLKWAIHLIEMHTIVSGGRLYTVDMEIGKGNET